MTVNLSSLEALERQLAHQEKISRLKQGLKSAEESEAEILDSLRAFRKFRKLTDSQWFDHLKVRLAIDFSDLHEIDTPCMESPKSSAESLEREVDERIRLVNQELEIEQQKLNAIVQLVRVSGEFDQPLREKVEKLAECWTNHPQKQKLDSFYSP
jgi:membrane-anchored protein YejM (alkaline phosphatase superfamily)